MCLFALNYSLNNLLIITEHAINRTLQPHIWHFPPCFLQEHGEGDAVKSDFDNFPDGPASGLTGLPQDWCRIKDLKDMRTHLFTVLFSLPSAPLALISQETRSETGQVISRERGSETRDTMV